MNKRLSWDEYFIEIAKATALRTTCLKRKVGAVITKDNRVLSTGYNGPPAGLSHCFTCIRSKSGENLLECRGVHAEQNAILYALKEFGDISDTSIYITTQPCTTCCKLIITAGIRKVVFNERYPDNYGLNLLLEAGIEVLEK